MGLSSPVRNIRLLKYDHNYFETATLDELTFKKKKLASICTDKQVDIHCYQYRMDHDPSFIKSQLTSLKKRVNSQRRSGAHLLAEDKHNNTEVSQPQHIADEAIPDDVALPTSLETVTSTPKNDTVVCNKLQSTEPVPVIKWVCQECSNECIPVMRESRCLCGHRLKEHKSNPKNKMSFPCSSKNCKCNHFFFLVAEGAWILRCRCKHKHTDHDCSPGVHKCNKCTQCVGFDSPWVCNCGHTWASHTQNTVLITEQNVAEVLGVKAAENKKQHFYRQDGLDG